LNANPSTMRPLIDLHHIELFLIWSSFLRADRAQDMTTWLTILTNRLMTRRSGLAGLPFIEGRNAMELVFEYVASGEKPDEFCDTSSVYLTCLMEMVCALPTAQRNPLLERVYRHLVLGQADCGTPMPNCEEIDLMSWIPPADWADCVLTQSLDHQGECVTIQLASFDGNQPATGDEIADRLSTLVTETRKKRTFKWPEGLPSAVVILACCKHRSPLPPEFWRSAAFPQTVEPQSPTGATA